MEDSHIHAHEWDYDPASTGQQKRECDEPLRRHVQVDHARRCSQDSGHVKAQLVFVRLAKSGRRRGRGPEVSPSRLPAASLPRVPAHLLPVASSPWWCRACAVPIARCLRAAAWLRPLLIHLVLPSGRPPLYAADESCSDRRWLLAFCCVARYYFPRLSRRVGGGAHRASEGSWSSWTSSTSWSS